MNAIATLNQQQTTDYQAIIENSTLAKTTKYQYSKAIRNYLSTGNNLFDTKALSEYSQTLCKSSRAFLKSAIRLITNETLLAAKASATPENVNQITAIAYRIEAMQSTIKVEKTSGSKAHTWLSQLEVKQLGNSCGSDLQGKRDYIVIGLLVCAGLRRNELANLTFEDITELPNRTVLNIEGKGSKNRIVPISKKLASKLNEWQAIVENGKVARSITKGGELGDSLSTIGIFNIVNKAGNAINKSELAPHDLRRTYAQLGYEAGIPLSQITKLLGHSSIATTQKYLNLDIDLEATISDFICL